MKTGTVTKITPAGTYDGKYGTLYQFYVTFDNGDNGKYSSKSENQTKFVVGEQAHYELTAREYQGKTFYNVKPVNPEFASQTQSASVTSNTPTASAPVSTGGAIDRNESIIRQTCIKAAAELGGTPQQVISNAQLFVDWVMGKGNATAQVTHSDHFAGRTVAQAPTPVAAANGDDLPF